MLCVTTCEICNPPSLLVLMESDDLLFHGLRLSCRSLRLAGRCSNGVIEVSPSPWSEAERLLELACHVGLIRKTGIQCCLGQRCAGA
jgi:hypothetical protein